MPPSLARVAGLACLPSCVLPCPARCPECPCCALLRGSRAGSQVICGLLASKTRVMVTHQLRFVRSPAMDAVVVLGIGGATLAVGTYGEVAHALPSDMSSELDAVAAAVGAADDDNAAAAATAGAAPGTGPDLASPPLVRLPSRARPGAAAAAGGIADGAFSAVVAGGTAAAGGGGVAPAAPRGSGGGGGRHPAVVAAAAGTQQGPEAHAKGTLSLRVLFRYVNSYGRGYAIPTLLFLYTVTQVTWGSVRMLARICRAPCTRALGLGRAGHFRSARSGVGGPWP
jgi:hypothetical protein